ncbi:MAG TPA: YidC/Oxa1 family membrane protein insertase [Paenibacillaceae bacterium]
MPDTTTEDLLHGNWWERNVVYYFSLMLDTFAEWFNGNYGIAILLLTIVVRTLILPLMIKQYKSAQAMQKLQPELMKIREKYKDDPRRQQEEMMRLYAEHQVNPLAGCLPLLIQMPILIALYNAIYYNGAIAKHTFLGMQLGKAPMDGEWYYYSIPIVAAATTYIQSKMMQAHSTGMQAGAMRAMLVIFPVMIFVMALSFPVALPLYWIYGNIYTIVQNYFMYTRRAKKKKEEETEQKTEKKSEKKTEGKGKSGKAAGKKPKRKGARSK